MRKFLLTVLAMLSAVAVYARPYKVTGTVYSDSGEPLAFANVAVESTTIGAVTDRNGRYELTLPGEGEYVIEASFLGYRSASRPVKGMVSSPVDFCLEEDLTNIGAVVVTGTRTPKLVTESPILTRLISPEDIRKADVTDISELLQAELPGIEFSYSMNQQVSLNMQGFGGTSVLFLVDGERLAGETLDNVDYSRLNLDNVERIEIVKGAASSLYGSNAVGGVVNIITKRATEPWQVGLDTRWGAHGEQRHGASVGFNAGRFNSMTDFQYYRIDSVHLGEGDYTKMYGHYNYNVREKLTFKVSDRMSLTARGGYFFRERDYQKTVKDRYRDFSGGLRMNYDIDDANTLEASYSFDQYDKSDYYTVTDKDIRDYSNIQHSVRLLYNTVFNGKHTLTVGGDALYDYIMTYQFADNGSHTMYSVDAFAQFDWAITDQLTMVSGLRFDYYSQTDPRVSPKLSFMYKPDRHATLRMSYAEGFRAPTLKEMYMDFDMASVFMIYGNPDLKAENSRNFSMSYEYAQSRMNFTANGYYNRVFNRISTLWNTELNGMKYMNMPTIDVAGADVNLSVKYPCGFGAKFSYAFTHEFFSPGEVRTTDTRPMSATLRLEYGRTWRNYGFNLSLSGRWLSPLDTNVLTSESSYQDFEAVHYPGYMMWKLSLSQTVIRAIDVVMTVDNIFNYKPDYYYYNSPMTTGTTFSVGVSVAIEQLFRKY